MMGGLSNQAVATGAQEILPGFFFLFTVYFSLIAGIHSARTTDSLREGEEPASQALKTNVGLLS